MLLATAGMIVLEERFAADAIKVPLYGHNLRCTASKQAAVDIRVDCYAHLCCCIVCGSLALY